ncbi:MAG: hypothetical protein AAFV95_04385 [Bacteroidota bacterium]
MNWMTVVPILILMTGAAVLGFLLARALVMGRREEVDMHRRQLMADVQDLKQQNTELIQHLHGIQDERHLMENNATRRKDEIQSLRQKIEQMEREKAFIIREFHQLKSEMQPGENAAGESWQKEKAEKEEFIEELKKTIVLLNNELNMIKDKTTINPLDSSTGQDGLEKFK